MPFQDDSREQIMAGNFNIVIPEDRSRIATDAVLPLPLGGGATVEVPFELKSMSQETASTARDVGPAHLLKWRNEHWAFGYFAADGRTMVRARYGSPEALAPWIDRLESYIRPDMILAERLPARVDYQLVTEMFGDAAVYPVSAAIAVHKKQWKIARYRAEADATLPDGRPGYSRAKLLEVVRQRTAYLASRGATLNNPSVPKRVLDTLPEFTGPRWAENLEVLVRPVVEARRALGLPF